MIFDSPINWPPPLVVWQFSLLSLLLVVVVSIFTLFSFDDVDVDEEEDGGEK